MGNEMSGKVSSLSLLGMTESSYSGATTPTPTHLSTDTYNNNVKAFLDRSNIFGDTNSVHVYTPRTSSDSDNLDDSQVSNNYDNKNSPEQILRTSRLNSSRGSIPTESKSIKHSTKDLLYKVSPRKIFDRRKSSSKNNKIFDGRHIIYSDNEINKFVLKSNIGKIFEETKKYKTEIKVVNSCDEFVKMISEQDYDMIWIDINTLDDISTLENIQSSKVSKDTIVVCVTSFLDAEFIKSCYDNGSDYVFPKPMGVTRIREVLKVT